MFTVVVFACVLCICFVWGSEVDSVLEYELPLIPKVLPTIEDHPALFNNTKGKRIPRNLWMAFKELPDRYQLPSGLQEMLDKNEQLGWTMHLYDNEAKLAFMEKYYHNTSVLWAYKAIHPKVGNSAADIWRYGVLYLFGGLYMDDDSRFRASFDEVIGIEDSLVVASEKGAYNDDCFIPQYRLSAKSMIKKYNESVPTLFGGRTLVSWGVFAEPRNPVMLRTLHNIVEIIRLEYLRKSVLNMNKYDVKWKICMCSTGPAVLTASAREVLSELTYTNNTAMHIPHFKYTMHKRDYHDYGGVFKARNDSEHASRQDEQHYMRTMQKHNIPLLANYSTGLQDGHVITSDGKELFYYFNHTRQGFADFDTFTAMTFTTRKLNYITDDKMAGIPVVTPVLTMGDVERVLNQLDSVKGYSM